jgi:cytoskeletal protein CcmA (bactofilin family)
MYTKNITLLLVLGAIFVVVPSLVSADTVLRTGDSVSIEKDQKIEGDFYTAAGTLNISGEVHGDLTSAGGKNTLNGPVANDALMLGGTVDVHGSVGDDLRVLAGDVIIAEPVTGDVFVMGGTVKVLSSASIGGDLIIYAGDAEVSGSVGGDIVGGVQNLRVDAPVAGKIDVTTENLTLGDRADIKNTIRYVSVNSLVRAQNAKVGGEITRNDPTGQASKSESTKAALLPILIVLFTVLVWYMVARSYLVSITTKALSRSVRPVLTGFIALFATPVVSIILLMTLLGSIVGIAGLFAYVLFIVLALVSSVVVIGQFTVNHLKKTIVPLSPLVIVVGVGITALLLFVPFIGPVVIMTTFLVTLGAIVDLLLHEGTK